MPALMQMRRARRKAAWLGTSVEMVADGRVEAFAEDDDDDEVADEDMLLWMLNVAGKGALVHKRGKDTLLLPTVSLYIFQLSRMMEKDGRLCLGRTRESQVFFCDCY